MNCAPYIICYLNDTTSKILSMIVLFLISCLLMLGMWWLNRHTENEIKKNKKLRKKYYE